MPSHGLGRFKKRYIDEFNVWWHYHKIPGNNQTLLGFHLIKKYIHTREEIFFIQKEDICPCLAIKKKKIILAGQKNISGRLGMYPNQNTLIRKAKKKLYHLFQDAIALATTIPYFVKCGW